MRVDPRLAVRQIYIVKPIGFDGPIKIGCSCEPANRLDAYLHWSPVPLEIVATFPGTPALEANIHSCLAASHSHKEWFFATDKVQAFVRNMLAGIPIEQALDLKGREGCIRSKGRAEVPPSRRLLTKWGMKVRWACKRTQKQSGIFPFPPLDVEIELERLRRAQGEVPPAFRTAPIEKFLSDPTRHAGSRWIGDGEMRAMLLPEPCA